MGEATWTFEETPPMGGATGEAFFNTLAGTGMAPVSVLARESTQNSVDAWDSRIQPKPKIAFRRMVLTGSEKSHFVQTLRLDDEFANRRSSLELEKLNCVATLDDDSVRLELLFIEDFGTHGLFGDPHSKDSHFHRLLLSLGDGSKARETDGSGGSYGYGKSVYSANSRIHTIVAYSALDPSMKGDDPAATRLMGCAYFNSHSHGGADFTGRAWFGTRRIDNVQIVDPFEDSEADHIALRLGFSSRSDGQSGTSILIVDSSTDVNELRRAIEDSWWPRILEDNLDVEIWDEGQRMSPPRPRIRKDLAPFVHCFDMAAGRTDPLSDQDKFETFNRMGGVALGSYGFTLLDEEQQEAVPEERESRVALIRRPRMVVAYENFGNIPLPSAGVFIADEEVDHALKLSEPAAHDRWDPRSKRLDNRESDERTHVEAIMRRLKVKFKEFANSAIPKQPKGGSRLKFLEQLLGSFFRPPTRNERNPNGVEYDPISVTFAGGPLVQIEPQGLRVTGTIRVLLKSDAEKDEGRFDSRCSVFLWKTTEAQHAIPSVPLLIRLTRTTSTTQRTKAQSSLHFARVNRLISTSSATFMTRTGQWTFGHS